MGNQLFASQASNQAVVNGGERNQPGPGSVVIIFYSL